MIKYFYPETIYSVTNALLDMFNDITIYKFEKDGTIKETYDVPITFSPVEKMHQARREEESGKKYYIQLPRLALVFNGHNFAPERAKSLNYQRFWNEYSVSGVDGYRNNISAGIEKIFTDYEPPPRNYYFSLYIWADGFREYSQIIENICPYFTPKNTLRVKEFQFLNIERDLQVEMGSVAADYGDDLDANNMRQIRSVIDLTVEGYMYKPFDASKVVKYIDSQYFTLPNNVKVGAYRTTGYTSASEMPDRDQFITSGQNVNGIYWTKQNTFSGDS